MSTVILPSNQVQVILNHFHVAGKLGSECVVLLLGCRRGEDIIIDEVWRPEQRAGPEFFEIPPHSMESLFTRLRSGRRMIAAQIHTHPGRAFHSEADDRWAIIRHRGALSLVVPSFARRTTKESFLQDTAVFQLSDQDCWDLVPSDSVHRYFQISHE